MRRNAGDWLWERIQDRAVMGGGLAMSGVAWLFGAALPAIGAPWWLAFSGGAVLVAWGATLWHRGWRLRDMKTGARAEQRIAQAIEYALTRDDCAVAHNVTELSGAGDIDHLVATPQRLWVLETKSGRIPQARFPGELARIAANIKRVRDWAGSGIEVTGALVFGHDGTEPVRPTYQSDGETIHCFGDADTLTRALQSRDRMPRTELGRRVWHLGDDG